MFLIKLKSSTLIYFIVLIVLIFYLYSDNGLEESKFIVVKGRLKETPKILEGGEDLFYKNLLIQLEENEIKYKLFNCGYNALIQHRMHKLYKGRFVVLKVLASENSSDIQQIMQIQVDELNIINESKYNSCENSRWIKLLILISLVVILLVVNIYRTYFR